MMIVLSRRPTEAICIADNVRIVVLRTSSGRVSLGIDAPKDIRVVREEIREQSSKAAAASLGCDHDKIGELQTQQHPATTGVSI